MKNVSKSEWFANWFDSPYYHILYKFRDHEEARFFLDNLVGNLKLSSGSRVLDLACGKGRHSIYLSKKGLDVTGVDLSPQSIETANQSAHEHLRFQVHDMREPYAHEAFDVVLNLFTSFGYFDDADDDQRVIQAISDALKPGGRVVIDFLNAKQLIDTLVPSETKSVNGIDFKLQRRFEDGFIVKEIAFQDDNQDYRFEEKVKAFTLADFERMFLATGLQILHTFGGYSLSPFSVETSDRLIVVAQKPG